MDLSSFAILQINTSTSSVMILCVCVYLSVCVSMLYVYVCVLKYKMFFNVFKTILKTHAVNSLLYGDLILQ